MSHGSLANQISYVLTALFWNKEKIEEYKTNHHVISVKRDLRPGGDPTRALPALLSYNTRAGYFKLSLAFFRHAKDLSGQRRLADLMDPEIVRLTLDTHYHNHRPATMRTLLAAIGKVHQCCVSVGWTKKPTPVTKELRAQVKAYCDDGDVRQPRFGYKTEDAEKVLTYLQDKGSAFSLAAEIALRCGLRVLELAGLKGENVDLDNLQLHIVGKGGKKRVVDLPADLAEKINPSTQYLFTPNKSWKRAFAKAVRGAASKLGIKIQGVHRLRSNYAQNFYNDLRSNGKSDHDARQEVSHQLGHNRIGITNSYIPHP